MPVKYLLALTLGLNPAIGFAENITECVPMGLRDGSVQINVLCNAKALNSRWNLAINQNSGCAAKNQTVERDGLTGQVLQQGSFTRPIGEGYRLPLRECTNEEGIAFVR